MITNTNKKSELTLNNNIDVPKSITIVEVIQKSDQGSWMRYYSMLEIRSNPK